MRRDATRRDVMRCDALPSLLISSHLISSHRIAASHLFRASLLMCFALLLSRGAARRGTRVCNSARALFLSLVVMFLIPIPIPMPCQAIPIPILSLSLALTWRTLYSCCNFPADLMRCVALRCDGNNSNNNNASDATRVPLAIRATLAALCEHSKLLYTYMYSAVFLARALCHCS